MRIIATDHRLAIQCAQDMTVALVMYACAEATDTETEKNLRRSKRELDAVLKRLLAKD